MSPGHPLSSRSSVSGLTRRGFLQAGSLATLGLGISELRADSIPHTETNCILLFLVGGPSQIDTWDPKPLAPESVRGPFRPIATRVPGIQISELFPRTARILDRVSLVRTLNHDAAPIHDAGHQLLQTGRLFSRNVEYPHFGSVVSYLQGSRAGLPAHVVLPGPIGRTGGNLPHGQSAGFLGASFEPFVQASVPPEEASLAVSSKLNLERESGTIRDRYGRTRFGENCLQARRLIESGVRFVTVNHHDTVFHEKSWDCHGSGPFSTLSDYQTHVAPAFDRAYSALLEDLENRGLLETTMVLAFGEFGRTPRINAAGGRDHHTRCWTGLFAGGPIQGGRVVGTSDSQASEPTDRPVSPGEVAATVYQGLGIDLYTSLPGPDGQRVPLVDEGVRPIAELF